MKLELDRFDKEYKKHLEEKELEARMIIHNKYDNCEFFADILNNYYYNDDHHWTVKHFGKAHEDAFDHAWEWLMKTNPSFTRDHPIASVCYYHKTYYEKFIR